MSALFRSPTHPLGQGKRFRVESGAFYDKSTETIKWKFQSSSLLLSGLHRRLHETILLKKDAMGRFAKQATQGRLNLKRFVPTNGVKRFRRQSMPADYYRQNSEGAS